MSGMRIPPSSGPSAFGFKLGGKNHLGSELQKHIKSYRELMKASNTQDLSSLNDVKKFLKTEKDAILDQCNKNGWESKEELNSAIDTIDHFLNNSNDDEGPFFKLDNAIGQVHYFLVNTR